MRISLKAALLSLSVAALLAGAVGASAASAEMTPAPWWGLNTGARPTNLSGRSGKDEVWHLRVSATKGDYLVVVGESIVPVAFDISATALREQLEALYPSTSTVSPLVTEQPGIEEDTRLYTITFPSRAMQPPLVIPDSEELALSFGGEALSGGKAEAELGEREKGEPSQNSVFVTAQNLGDGPTSGKVTISDQLPPGLTPVAIDAIAGGPAGLSRGPVSCQITTLTCTFEKFTRKNEAGETEVVTQSLPPFETIEMRIKVQVSPSAKDGEVNTATVTGGDANSSVSASHPLAVGTAQHYGVEDFSLIPEEPGGTIDTQAGSHPFQLTGVVTLNSQTPDNQGNPRTVALAKDIVADLPPGLVGNPVPFAQCTDEQFAADDQEHEEAPREDEVQKINACPASSAIGVATVKVDEPADASDTMFIAPIFNMVPRQGEPVRFGFKAGGLLAAFLDTSVRTGSDYGVSVSSLNIPQVAWLLSAQLTFWGVPGAPEHDHQRGWECLLKLGGAGACPATNASAPPPFLVMPSSCQEPFEASVRTDSWAASGKPAEVAEPFTYRLPEAIDGCNHLPFAPEVRVTPDGTAASTPTGLNVDVHVPQSSILHAESLAESAVKDITVALPPGVAVNPAGSDGLGACSEGLAGFTGFSEDEPGSRRANFTPALPEPLAPGSNFCPDASKIGTVDIASPLLPAGQHLNGAVYLATQNENPFGSLIALYIIAEDPISGVVVKLLGETHLSETGQLITTFKNSPQLPFEDAELHFFGGERASLATPSRCGAYTTNASFAPWSGNGAVSSSSTFNINSGPNGTPCPGASLPFSPSLTGGTTNINAGSFSPLTTTIGREDGNQNMQSVQLHMPAGLAGLLSGVRLCPEAQANAGSCGPESLIGETTVSAGVGSDPVSVTGGRVYITEKYGGSPFGLSIVNPVKAGPFDLEHDTSNPGQDPACDCVVVRARIDVDPSTAALTITTDPSGPYAIPHLIDGIPVQIKKVNVLINRPGFTFNPTNCSSMSITGSIGSDEGASSPVSVPFQATNCATLAFAPKFAVSTSGKTSKANGASLAVKLTYPSAAFGSQANIKQVKVELPKQLPSRLTTLQKACTAAQFNANPAGCPAASVIGHAKAVTPLLPVPLEGPAYFVSHGGEAFPSLIVVLQGAAPYNVTLDLVGATFISKAGITSSTFKTVPDAPVGSFELTLPEGKYSALAANGNLCTSKLAMPTEFLAQNGAKTDQKTSVSVTGCAKTKALTRAQKLAAALKACKKKTKGKRAACNATARKRYGPVKTKSKTKGKHKA
jgi:hypothetical protein